MSRENDCEWQDSCDCTKANKLEACHKCKFYYEIDSGYGWCRALPTFTAVGWCRDICGLFVKGD